LDFEASVWLANSSDLSFCLSVLKCAYFEAVLTAKLRDAYSQAKHIAAHLHMKLPRRI
jgi:hypothetical protein